MEALVSWLPEKARGWKLGARTGGAFRRYGVAAVLLALIPLIPSLISLPALVAPPRPSGKALAQAWFDEQFDTQAGRRYIRKGGGRPLQFVGESYTVYLDPSRVNVEIFTSMTHIQRENSEQMIRGPQDLIDLGYDVALLGTGMYHRFYDNPDAFPQQVRLYDALLGADGSPLTRATTCWPFAGMGCRCTWCF